MVDFISTPAVPKFHFLNPVPEEIFIGDIALGLSHTCRFGGLCKTFYSVAEHSIIVAEILEGEGAEPLTILAGLLHDGEEAYLPDIPLPIKARMPEASSIYARLNRAIVEKYCLQKADWKRIGIIDRQLCIAEAKILGIWNEDWEDVGLPLKVKLYLWSSAGAEDLFLRNFIELGEKCYEYKLRI